MKNSWSFSGVIQKFPGSGGWYYVAAPKKLSAELKTHRKAWGMFPITVTVGKTTWNTKLMTLKDGNYFVALRVAIRKKEDLVLGDKIKLKLTIID